MAKYWIRAALLLALTSLLSPRLALAQTWDRELAPGMLFRMERQANPQRNIYGLKLAPGAYHTESVLARTTVYDLSPTNGRDTVSGMVRDYAASGGVNGDFFQFGQDPGGDPVNLMVRGGELLSQPGNGSRAFAVGWGPGGEFSLGPSTWDASYRVNGGAKQTIHSLNARADGGQITLWTDSAGYAYASAPAHAARVRVGAYRLGPEGTLSGTVTGVVPVQGRVRVAPGELLLSGAGSRAAVVETLKPGDKITVEVRVTGFDWSKVQQVMGGGPVLLRSGKNALPTGPDGFSDTRHPRTAMGQTADGSLWFVVVDGRQAMSVGASLTELAEILRQWGCVDAINLDGGGSSAINALGLTLNRPSGGVERTVANGVLFFGSLPVAAPTGNRANISVRTPVSSPAVGQPLHLEVTRNGSVVPDSEVVFTAQGAAWIDQTGTLYPVKEGPVDITVLVGGQTAKLRLTIAAK